MSAPKLFILDEKKHTTDSHIKNNEQKNSKEESYAYMYAHVQIRYKWKRETTNKHLDYYLTQFYFSNMAQSQLLKLLIEELILEC
jgi:hypothetical protein